MRRKIIKVGSSRGVLLPREVTRAMKWDLGTEVELNVDKENKEIILKTIKINLPDDFDVEMLKKIEETMSNYGDILEGIDD